MSVAVNYSYKDRNGIVHGPFSAEQMMYWYNSAFFTEQLEVLIQPDNEQPVITNLGRLIIVNGNNEPFLAVSGPPPQKTQVKSEFCSDDTEATKNVPHPVLPVIKTKTYGSAEENRSKTTESILTPVTRFTIRPLPLLGKKPETDQFLSFQEAELGLYQLESMIKNMPECFLRTFPANEDFRDQECSHCGQFLEGVKSVLEHVISYEHLSKIDKVSLTEGDITFWKTKLEEIFSWGRRNNPTEVVEKQKLSSEGCTASETSSDQPVSPISSTVTNPCQPIFIDKFAIAKSFSERIELWDWQEKLAFDVLSSWEPSKTCAFCNEMPKRPSDFFQHLFTERHCENMLLNYSQKDLDEYAELISMVENVPQEVRRVPKGKQKYDLKLYKKSLKRSADLAVLTEAPMKILRWISSTLGITAGRASPAKVEVNYEEVPEKKPRLNEIWK